ncbi:hypothetical protein EJB05_55235, partial [Eragrostis curvula]
MAGEEECTVEGRYSTKNNDDEEVVPGKLDDPAMEKPVPEGICSDDGAGCFAAGAESGEESAMSDAGSEHEDAEEEADADDDDDGATDSDADARMSGTDYVLAYKELPQYEIDLILAGSVEHEGFTDTELFKSMTADPSVTPEDIAAAAVEHEDRMDARARFREYVREEYKAKGYVGVSDEYIAKRVRTEEIWKKMWEELFADSDDDDDDGSDEEQEERQKSAV